MTLTNVCSDSGVSGSQEADLAPSPSMHSSQVPGTRSKSGSSASVQFCTLVRKLSEVEGIDPQHILR